MGRGQPTDPAHRPPGQEDQLRLRRQRPPHQDHLPRRHPADPGPGCLRPPPGRPCDRPLRHHPEPPVLRLRRPRHGQGRRKDVHPDRRPHQGPYRLLLRRGRTAVARQGDGPAGPPDLVAVLLRPGRQPHLPGRDPRLPGAHRLHLQRRLPADRPQRHHHRMVLRRGRQRDRGQVHRHGCAHRRAVHRIRPAEVPDQRRYLLPGPVRQHRQQ